MYWPCRIQGAVGGKALAELSVSEFQNVFNVTTTTDYWHPKSLVLNDAIYHSINTDDIPKGIAEGGFP